MRLLLAALLLLPAAAQAEGMPQLDFANPLTTSQVVWGAIIFAVLYLLFSRMALPQVAGVLHTRAGKIAADLEAARAAKAAADGAVAELTRATQAAHAGAQAEILEALTVAKAAAAAQAAVLSARLEAQIADAERRIAAARAAALGALQEVALDTATTMVARLAGVAPDHGAVERAVAAALSARRARAAEA